MIRPVNPASFDSSVLAPGSETLEQKYGIRRPNKAHTATAHRVAKRFGVEFNAGPGFDVCVEGLVVEVETTATMLDAVARLSELESGRVYVAMTNKDGVTEALRAIVSPRIGIMDAHGNVVRESEPAPSLDVVNDWQVALSPSSAGSIVPILPL